MNLPYMISYAQNFEDVLLRRALHDVERGFYVDVGAQHPTVDSVTYHFYKQGWRGINVEPHPHYFAALQKKRARDVNVSAAISNRRDELSFYFVDDTGLSSLDPQSLQIAREKGYRAYERKVSCVPLSGLLEQHAPTEIHFLKVDVEGAERSVLESADLSRFRPWIVLAEATPPNDPTPCYDAFEDVMLASRYQPVLFDGLNRWYVRAESANLAERLLTPVNVYDNFQRVKEVEWKRLRSVANRLTSPFRR